MKTNYLSTLAITLICTFLCSCSSIGIHYGATYSCTAKNLTSQKVFTGYGKSKDSAKASSLEQCKQGSEYAWRCSPENCQPYQSIFS